MGQYKPRSTLRDHPEGLSLLIVGLVCTTFTPKYLELGQKSTGSGKLSTPE